MATIEQLDQHMQHAMKHFAEFGGYIGDSIFTRFYPDRRYVVRCLAGSGNEHCGTYIMQIGNSRFYVDYTRKGYNKPWDAWTIERYKEWRY